MHKKKLMKKEGRKMKEKMKQKNLERGITLIALVITISELLNISVTQVSNLIIVDNIGYSV